MPVTWVAPDWVAGHLDDADVLLLDPRRPMKYMSGHLKGAVNLPVYTAFDGEARLFEPNVLAAWAADAGLSNGVRPLLYDSFDGQNGAMLSWILQYLGCPEVLLMDTFYEGWAADGGEVFYRPVPPTPAHFTPSLNESIRARFSDVGGGGSAALVDFRSEPEFTGEDSDPGQGGHIPGAAHVQWRSVVGDNNAYLKTGDELSALLQPSVGRLGRCHSLLPHGPEGVAGVPGADAARADAPALRRLDDRLPAQQRPSGIRLALRSSRIRTAPARSPALSSAWRPRPCRRTGAR